MKSTTCSKAFNNFIWIFKRNLQKTPSTLMETLIYWYELYDKHELSVVRRFIKFEKKKKYVMKMNIRVTFNNRKVYYKKVTIKGKDQCNKWLDDYARSFCSYIKHAERGKKDRRAIASGSLSMRMHLRVVEEFHLRLAKKINGSTISIGGEEKKKKIMAELQLSSLKENIDNACSLQATEDATKWNECLNPLLFEIVHKCWLNDGVREQCTLPAVTDEETVFSKICTMTFYYMLIKRIHLGVGFLFENEYFYTRIPWHKTKNEMLNEYNREWFKKLEGKIDENDYIPASPGFLMGMLNAASTTMGLVAIGGVRLSNTVVRSLRSSDDSMTVFVAESIPKLANLICLAYSSYRLFGINPSTEKTILFPEKFGEYTSWFQDTDFVGQYGVETSSLKPVGQNPQDDFNSLVATTLQLFRT